MDILLSLKAKIKHVIMLIGIIFVSICVCTYYPYDPSYFFVTSSLKHVANYAGFFGAHVAALLFFMCGSGVLVLIVLAWVYVVRWFLHGTGMSRLSMLAAAVLVLLFSLLESLCRQYFFLHGFVPGGYIGGALNFLASKSIDYEILMAGTLWGIFTSIVVQLNFAGIVYVQYIVNCCSRFIRYFYLEQCWMFPYNIGKIFCNRWLFKSTVYSDNLISQNEDTKNSIERSNSDISVVQESLTNGMPDLFEQALHEKFSLQDAPQDVPQQEKNEKIQNGSYQKPSKDLFKKHESLEKQSEKSVEQENIALRLQEKLERFGIQGSVRSIKNGPVVTLFEYEPEMDIKLSRILALEDDLALALEATSIRIMAPIPGKSVVGFEVARKERQFMSFASIVHSKEFNQQDYVLPLVLGVTTIGRAAIVDLVRMPHLLVAGATGSGKSVALNVFLASLLMQHSPDSLKLVLIDPKQLEFAPYADIPHLLFPIITQPQEALLALKWLVSTMNERYSQMAACGVRSVQDYNSVCHKHEMEPFAHIVVMIDELADLMMVAGKDIEDYIARLAQMARAAGIHLIVATQRPSVDVITGLIKANFPSRISFRVATKIDARTIIDMVGAEKLLGKGDMLYLDTASHVQRVHGAFITDAEIEKLVKYVRSMRPVDYLSLHEIATHQDQHIDQADKQLYCEVLNFIQELDELSISLIQRKFKIGYNRSARIIEQLEAEGRIISLPGSKMRKVVHS